LPADSRAATVTSWVSGGVDSVLSNDIAFIQVTSIGPKYLETQTWAIERSKWHDKADWISSPEPFPVVRGTLADTPLGKFATV
jgi:hypothetical protein